MRIHDMPRARMFTIVTMKLIAPASDAIVRMWIDRIHSPARDRGCTGSPTGADTTTSRHAVPPPEENHAP